MPTLLTDTDTGYQPIPLRDFVVQALHGFELAVPSGGSLPACLPATRRLRPRSPKTPRALGAQLTTLERSFTYAATRATASPTSTLISAISELFQSPADDAELGTFSPPYRHAVLFTTAIELKTAELPRWKPYVTARDPEPKDPRMTFNRDKFKALVHYICRACTDPSKLGKVKLHKILWYSDGSHFLRRGEPITGETYIKKQYGPFAIHLEDAVADLVHEGKLFVHQAPYFGQEKTEFIAKGDSDKGMFSEKELAIVDTNIEYICEDHTAASISERTHNEIWEMAALNEPLPYDALLVARFLEPTEDDFCWAKDEIAKLR